MVTCDRGRPPHLRDAYVPEGPATSDLDRRTLVWLLGLDGNDSVEGEQLIAQRRMLQRRTDPVYLTRRGQRVAAVIDSEDLDRLIAAAEDLADIEAARAARAEIADGEPVIPWEQVKADLGLA